MWPHQRTRCGIVRDKIILRSFLRSIPAALRRRHFPSVRRGIPVFLGQISKQKRREEVDRGAFGRASPNVTLFVLRRILIGGGSHYELPLCTCNPYGQPAYFTVSHPRNSAKLPRNSCETPAKLPRNRPRNPAKPHETVAKLCETMCETCETNRESVRVPG